MNERGVYAKGGVCKRGYNDQGNLWLPGASTGSVTGEKWLRERGGRFDGLSDRSGHFDRLSDRKGTKKRSPDVL